MDRGKWNEIFKVSSNPTHPRILRLPLESVACRVALPTPAGEVFVNKNSKNSQLTPRHMEMKRGHTGFWGRAARAVWSLHLVPILAGSRRLLQLLPPSLSHGMLGAFSKCCRDGFGRNSSVLRALCESCLRAARASALQTDTNSSSSSPALPGNSLCFEGQEKARKGQRRQ